MSHPPYVHGATRHIDMVVTVDNASDVSGFNFKGPQFFRFVPLAGRMHRKG
jgi:hypothetical protein